MTKKALDEEKLNSIFSSANGSKHVLHLYAPTMNQRAIQASFLSGKKMKTVYVTGEDPKEVARYFKPMGVQLTVVSPKDFQKLSNFKRIVIDAGSINPSVIDKIKSKRKRLGEEELLKEFIDHSKREKHLSEFNGKHILCTYDLSKLNPKKIKSLVEAHDKLILTTDGTTILSNKSISNEISNLKPEQINQFVKTELETIVLALLVKLPMCGTDLKKAIYEKFNILLSSGTLYPLLHKLKKDGLLKCSYGIKTKKYEPAKKSEVESILNKRIQARNFLNGFLQSTIAGERKEIVKEIVGE